MVEGWVVDVQDRETCIHTLYIHYTYTIHTLYIHYMHSYIMQPLYNDLVSAAVVMLSSQ